MLIQTFPWQDFEVQVKLDRNVFLVDILNTTIGRVLVLDSVKAKAPFWLKNDFLIFNTFQWWYYKGAKQPLVLHLFLKWKLFSNFTKKKKKKPNFFSL